jgi:uncharacterized protein
VSNVSFWVVIDTSVWVSAILTPHGPPGQIVRAFREGRFQIVMSAYLFAELFEVLRRPRIRRRHADRPDAEELLALLRSRARVVETTGAIVVCRDPLDDLILETAIVGRARYLVSRDEDLTRDLALVEALRINGVDVVTVARFLEQLESGQI